MKKLILVAMLAIFTTGAFAINSNDVIDAGFSSLSTQEKADIVKMIAQKKALKSTSTVPKAKQVQEWVDLGSSIGKGLSASAKELGIAVNDFSKTSVGKWTMILIIFQVMGAKILGFFAGLLFMALGVTLTTVVYNRANPYLEEYKDGKLFKKTRKNDEENAAFWFAYLFIIGVGTLIIVLV